MTDDFQLNFDLKSVNSIGFKGQIRREEDETTKMLRDLMMERSCVLTQTASTERYVKMFSIDITNANTETVLNQTTSERPFLSKVRVVMMTIKIKGKHSIIIKTKYKLRLKIKWSK